MDTAGKVKEAAHNNAQWCDAICRAHRVGGEFHEQYWINFGAVPPYISKLVTLSGENAARQLTAIQSLLAREPEGFSVKDAFQCLDLGRLGFEVLFHATWIYWTPGTPIVVDAAENLEWSVVQGARGLSEWEKAWRGSSANASVEGQPRVFPSSLLAEQGLHFLAGRLGDQVVASAALNRTGHVVGLCNVFTGVTDAGPLYPGCVRLAAKLYPDTPIVGYERGEALTAAERAGFAGIHGLTVWLRATVGP